MRSDFSWVSVLAAIFLVRWLAFEAILERAARKGEELVFRPPIGLRLLFGIALPGFIYAAGAVAFSQNWKEEWWLSAMFIAFAVSVGLAWPPDISVTKSAIYERKWLGLRKKTINWDDVDYAATDPYDDSVEVVSKSGLKIKHTKYHVDRRDFLAELKNRGRLLEPGRSLG